MSTHHHQVQVTTWILPAGAESKFELPDNAALQEGALHAGVQLLPPAPEKPLDQLHDLSQHGQVGPPITNLDQPLSCTTSRSTGAGACSCCPPRPAPVPTGLQ